MKTSEDPAVENAKIPCQMLLEISLTPQNEARFVASQYTGRVNFARAICRATIRKQNVDSHYNHKMNKHCNAWIYELYDAIYKLYP